MLSLFQGQSVNSAIKTQPDLFVCQNTFISLLIYGYDLTGESKTLLSLLKKSFTRSLELLFARRGARQRCRSWRGPGSAQLHRRGAARASPCACKNRLKVISMLPPLRQDCLLASPPREPSWHWGGRHAASSIPAAFSQRGQGTELARTQLWEAPTHPSSCCAGASRAIAGRVFQACSEDIRLHMPRIPWEVCHVILW